MSATEHRLGVAGWPVAHSRSPAMQNAALRAVGLQASWHYQHLPIPPELFAETVAALPGSGFRGINVTIPHKQAALEFALASGGEVSERASAIGAVNTLVFEADGALRADNTDAPALLDALKALPGAATNAGRPMAGRTALVLGAGGSARAAVWALLGAGAAGVQVWNRTPERAEELTERVGSGALRAVGAAELTPADVVVNCTSVGLRKGEGLGELPLSAELLGGAALLVDFVYRPGATAFAAAAAEAGVSLIDGLELLVLQGAQSFTQFTGVSAPLAVMRAAVKE